MAWSLCQFEPQIWLVLSRAKAAEALQANDYPLAVQVLEEGLEHLRGFFREHGRPEAAEQSGEVFSLEAMLEEIRAQRPLTPRERLERALEEAVKREDYERAAQVRDELRNLAD
jgi:excinuclease UvrABC helicase subunit UvrB